MNQLLTYSIYYHQSEWHRLLKHVGNCVNSNNVILYYFVKLSIDRGPHLQLTIVPKKNYAPILVDDFSKLLTTFLIESPSSTVGLEKTSNILFADFPNNTIHYGIDDWKIRKGINKVALEHHHKISIIIVALFEEYQELTWNMTVEIDFQIISIYYMAVKKDVLDSIESVDRWIVKQLSMYDNHNLSKIEKHNREIYENHKEALLDFANDLYLRGESSLTENWQMLWFNFVKQASQDVKGASEILPEILMGNLYHNELIIALKLFRMCLEDLNNFDYKRSIET